MENYTNETTYTQEQLTALAKANEVAMECSKEMEDINNKLMSGEIDNETYATKHYAIESRLFDVWIRKDSTSRFPDYFSDLKVPQNLRSIFEDMFGDF